MGLQGVSSRFYETLTNPALRWFQGAIAEATGTLSEATDHTSEPIDNVEPRGVRGVRGMSATVNVRSTVTNLDEVPGEVPDETVNPMVTTATA